MAAAAAMMAAVMMMMMSSSSSQQQWLHPQHQYKEQQYQAPQVAGAAHTSCILLVHGVLMVTEPLVASCCCHLPRQGKPPLLARWLSPGQAI
jgi:hypothetical protein